MRLLKIKKFGYNCVQLYSSYCTEIFNENKSYTQYSAYHDTTNLAVQFSQFL